MAVVVRQGLGIGICCMSTYIWYNRKHRTQVTGDVHIPAVLHRDGSAVLLSLHVLAVFSDFWHRCTFGLYGSAVPYRSGWELSFGFIHDVTWTTLHALLYELPEVRACPCVVLVFEQLFFPCVKRRFSCRASHGEC